MSDQVIARSIASALVDAGIAVLDQTNIAFGQNLLATITDAIDQSDAIIIIISQTSATSEWVQLESSLAVGSALSGDSKVVLPVSVGPYRNIPSALSQIKALQIEPSQSPEQVGIAVVDALRKAMPPPNPSRLYKSIAWQANSLRAARLQEEVEYLRASASAASRAIFIAAIAGIVALVALVVSSIIVLRSSSSPPHTFEWLQVVFISTTLVASVQALYTTMTMRMRKSKQSGHSLDDEEPRGGNK